MTGLTDGTGWKLPTPRWVVYDDGEARLALDGDDYTITIEGLGQWAPDTGTDLPDSLRVRTCPRAPEAAEPQSAPERHIEFTCSICLYDYVDWSTLDEDELASRHFLTVINGHMTCEYHASIAGGGEFGLKLLAAKQHGMRS